MEFLGKKSPKFAYEKVFKVNMISFYCDLDEKEKKKNTKKEKSSKKIKKEDLQNKGTCSKSKEKRTESLQS